MAFKLGKLVESLIYENADEQTQEQQTVSVQEPANAAVTSQQPVQTTQVSQPTIPAGATDGTYTGKVRELFAQNMVQELEARDIPGPDYKEIKDMFESDDMKQNIPDTNSRWKTAFSMLKMMNKSLTKKIVLDSIDVYVNVIEEERQNALKQIEMKSDSLVTQKEAKVAEVEKRIQNDEKEIKLLQEKINKINEKIKGDREFIESTHKEIETGKTEIFVDKADLEVTATAIKNTLLEDKKILDSVLPND